ncbi:hypothetical protein LEM8419_03028 [Neolewinella maritima]|uniref:Uncharacterized protein n=1 Tax=Neolewinella maritima TaxID=1383882 RepID=A0ABM9B439_9BACT|nr:hypothetical protein [Neolewinella maritima]CAH1002111.1 hypothetical protein LEM8419_03028 [Neolewinella maritima]
MQVRFLTALAALLFTTAAAAQGDALIDIDIDKTEWYENPILWVVVAGFFILLIVLTRRKAA